MITNLDQCYKVVDHLETHYPAYLHNGYDRVCRCSDGHTLVYPACVFMVDKMSELYLESRKEVSLAFWNTRLAFWNTLVDEISEPAIKMELYLLGYL